LEDVDPLVDEVYRNPNQRKISFKISGVTFVLEYKVRNHEFVLQESRIRDQFLSETYLGPVYDHARHFAVTHQRSKHLIKTGGIQHMANLIKFILLSQGPVGGAKKSRSRRSKKSMSKKGCFSLF
jgi:hypothetical protein